MDRVRIRSELIGAFPRLAWLAEVTQPLAEVRIRVGSSVEVRDNFVVEGAWDGPFDAGAFDRTDAFFGSGAVAHSEGVTFVPSAATTDSLFYHVGRDAAVAVSNSLPLLLASLDDSLDPRYRAYDRFNDSVIDGIDHYERDLVTRRGGVRRLLFRNLVVRAGGAEEVDKPLPAAFANYDAYVSYLERTYASIAANARDPHRTRPLKILSTQSRGYDTTAVNAIAARYGIDRAFTVTKAKGGPFANMDAAKQQDDDGSAICGVLGVPCTPIDRRRFERSFDREVLYHACQHANQDANLLDVNDQVDGVAILLTGVLGEIWYGREYYQGREATLVTPELRRGDLGNHGLSEVRLEVGLIQVPLPYLGARRRADVYRITTSAEMEPWRLHTAYDRPIPRRIAEERGVPREWFGQVKMASVVEFALPRVPSTPSLRAEYFAFLLKERVLTRWQLASLPTIRRINEWFVMHLAVRYYFERVASVVLRRPIRWRGLWRWLNGSIFCFAVNKRREEYLKALQQR